MLSQKDFIEASKKFVCIRLETYENKETQDRIRDLLSGSMQNTAFVVYAPDGKTKLTRSHRSPQSILGGRGSKDIAPVIDEMGKIADKYKVKGSPNQEVLQDFDSFKQSLNVASADQRLLVFTVSPQSKMTSVKKTLRAVFNNPSVSGKFHFDIAGKGDVKWAESLKNVNAKTGIFLIRSHEFGQDGIVVKALPLDVSPRGLKADLLAMNKKFSEFEKRKDYGKHVNQGRREGVKFENNIQQGEDRDGDGKIDEHKPGQGRRGDRSPRGGGRFLEGL
ncbi:hypothetical protein [Rubritalea profundi]|uniref:Uncharacterized protein n=1 Tax=Rubritalea profundi TaxID=1658618 RepID=A0A2S7TYA5_9BACT|nr:hypothetical protein [Rubritalea profundi]PQJ27726.1 hypothetical protein BSZ32_03900 [Rubritalea profundi]